MDETTEFSTRRAFYYGLYKLYLRKTPGLNYASLTEEDTHRLVDIAARHLKEMDDYLKHEGIKHLLVITPTKMQALNQAPKDPFVAQSLNKYGLKPKYLLDAIMTQDDISSLYHDVIHLSEKGHALWGGLIQEEIKHIVTANRI